MGLGCQPGELSFPEHIKVRPPRGEIERRAMALFEDNTQVFIVRVWLERREIEGAKVKWRGVIEHVPSGERRYLKDLDDILVFIRPYLKGMRVNFGVDWRLRQWLKRCRINPKSQT
jgi:hypothetical protein